MKIILTNLGSLTNEPSAIALVNSNNNIIATAFDNTLSRDGTSPNQMLAPIDMNSQRLLNLPAPVSNLEPLRLIDIAALINQTGILPSNIITTPQGRLTLTSGTPVTSTSVSGANKIFYTPYAGSGIPIYAFNGSGMNTVRFTELTNTLANSATGNAGPAAVVANAAYDLYVWDTGAGYALTRTPAWSTINIPGAGVSTSRNLWGVETNNNAITNGPRAGFGTYVGSFMTNSAGLVDDIYGASGTGGVAAVFNLWNAFNRISVQTMVQDSTASWTFTGSAFVFRAANGSANIQVRFFRGRNEDGVRAQYDAISNGVGGGGTVSTGIGLDSTTTYTGTTGYNGNNTAFQSLTATYAGLPGVGYHTLTALECNSNTGTSTWFGDNPGLRSSGLSATLVK